MNHVNLIGKIIKPLDPAPSDPKAKKEGTCFLLQTTTIELNDQGRSVKRYLNHRIVLKLQAYQKFARLIQINQDVAIEGTLYKGKVIVTDLIIL